MKPDGHEPAFEPEASTDEAAPNRFVALADVQDLDVRLSQIEHRVEHLPERDARAEIVVQMAALSRHSATLDAQINDLARQQRRREDEVSAIEAKRAHNSERLYDSHLTSPKEAEALEAERDALERRQIEIEDLILELMEQIEPLATDRSDLADREAEAKRRLSETDAHIAQSEADARAERDEVLGIRTGLVASTPAELIDLYEQRRVAARGAPAVGRLIGTTCNACHLEISAVDADRIGRMDADEPADCPQCGVLLVR